MNKICTMFILALLTVTTARGEVLDTLQVWLQRGDSLMQQYNTYEALKYYLQAYEYYRQFLELARQEAKPTQQLTDMISQAERMTAYYEKRKE